jgi:hypothetical protein
MKVADGKQLDEWKPPPEVSDGHRGRGTSPVVIPAMPKAGCFAGVPVTAGWKAAFG